MPRYNPHKTYRTTPKRSVEPLPKETIPDPAPVSHVPVLTENEEKDGFEIRFPAKPDESVLARFRANKDLPSAQRWHWHFRGHFWYAKRNPVTRAFAESIIGAPVAPAPLPAPGVPVVPAAPASQFAGGDPVPLNAEHASFPKSAWALEVQDGSTHLGYEEWVEAKVELAAEEAEAAEPAEPADHQPSTFQPSTNILPVAFTSKPAPVEQPVEAITESAVPDWRARFSWSARH
jgi:hypothetical protein